MWRQLRQLASVFLISVATCVLLISALAVVENQRAGPLGLHLANAAGLQVTPTLTLVHPSSAFNDLDTPILITGSGFISTPAVYCGDTSLTDVTWVSTTLLEAIVPWGLAPDAYALTVENPGGETGSLPSAFTVTQGIGVWNATALYGGSVSELALNPITSTTLYAVSQDVGLFRSTDGASHWSFVTAGAYVRNLAVAPNAPDTLYMSMIAQGSHGLHRSDDGGDSWTPLDTPADIPFPHPIDPQTLFAASGTEVPTGLWKSTDAGQTWVTKTTGLTDTRVSTLVYYPADPLTIYVGTELGNLFVSSDGGDTWSFVARPTEFVQTLAINPRGDHELWVSSCCFCTSKETLKSTNGGHTAWVPVADPVGADSMTTIEFAPLSWDDGAYAGTALVNNCWSQSHLSENGGDDWAAFGQGIQLLDPADSDVAYGTGQWEGVIKTSDGGATWQVTNEGLTAMVTRDLATVPSQSDTVYALTNRDGGVYEGTRGGAVWQFLTVPGLSWAPNALLVDPVTPTRIYVEQGASAYVYVLISEDGGDSWPVTVAIPVEAPYDADDCPSWINAFAATPAEPGTVLAGVEHFCMGVPGVHGGDLYYSVDAGLEWTQATISAMDTISPVIAIVHDVLTPTIVYASTGLWDMGSGLLRSTDGGRNWTRVGAAVVALDFVEDLAVEQSAPYRIFALTNSAGIYVSADHGLTWAQAVNPLLGSQIERFLCAADDPSILYAAVSQSWRGAGLYRSRDGAQTWERAPDPLGRTPIYSLATVSDDDRVFLYAGTTGGIVAAPAALAQAAGADTLVSAGVYRFAQRTWRIYLPLLTRASGP